MVFNLTVDYGMYYANGVLVSNCDADRYLSVTLAATNGEKILPKAPDTPPPIHRLDVAKRIAMLKKKSRYNGTPYD